ncbi:MAG: TolC family protein [Campylobacterota bacterium]|nr:TolC family protein [Campylobacterota bacterium]
MKILFSMLCAVLLLNASDITNSNPLSLDDALEILKSENLEIKTASFDVNSAKIEEKTATGNYWGKLNFIQDVASSNDAGNVFGFKLTSREADFGDFGAEEFMNNMDACQGGDMSACSNMYTSPPENLNNPDSRTFFQTKLKYEIPLFTGFQINSYAEIMSSMTKMKTLEKSKVVNEKIYQLRKSFYDMALLKDSTKHLNTILTNIDTLENVTKNMIDVGYAKKVDLLEVQSKKGNVERLVAQMGSNQKLLYHYIGFLLNQNITEIQTPPASIAMPTLNDENILNNNLDIQKASTGLEIRKSMINVEKSAYYPMVGAFGELATADDSFLGNASDHASYTVGARLTWNLYNGGIDDAKLEKSRIEHLKTQTQVQLAKKGIALQIAKIRTEIQTFDEEIISLEKELTLADAIYKNYEGRYKEKLSSMSDVIIKQSEQIQKILQLQMSHNKRNERIFALEKLANGEK